MVGDAVLAWFAVQTLAFLLTLWPTAPPPPAANASATVTIKLAPLAPPMEDIQEP